MTAHVVEQLKAKGKYREAGAMARKENLPRSYGCHYGMRSDLEASRAAFYAGYDSRRDMTGTCDMFRAKGRTWQQEMVRAFTYESKHEQLQNLIESKVAKAWITEGVWLAWYYSATGALISHMSSGVKRDKSERKVLLDACVKLRAIADQSARIPR